jgi:hypothetical protein
MLQLLSSSPQIVVANSIVSHGTIVIIVVTSRIAWEWGCTYMYKRTILDTKHFKAVMAMNLSKLRS